MTWELAVRRVTIIRKQYGAWPGVIGPDSDGWYRLAYDPGDEPAMSDA